MDKHKPKIVLTYFAGRGSAELARLILAAGKMDFEDVRLSQEDWVQIKADTPYMLPILEFDGAKLSHPIVISRFLAKKADLAGETDLDQAHAEMAVDAVHCLYLALLGPPRQLTDEELKEALMKVYNEKIIPTLDFLEKVLKERGGKHFAGNKLSWADLYTMNFLDSLTDSTDPLFENRLPEISTHIRRFCLKGRPLLAELLKTVKDIPEIKEHYKNRVPNDKELF